MERKTGLEPVTRQQSGDEEQGEDATHQVRRGVLRTPELGPLSQNWRWLWGTELRGQCALRRS